MKRESFFLALLSIGMSSEVLSMKVYDFSVHDLRRENLSVEVKKCYPEKKGLIALFANFEQGSGVFCQESSFYYLTGVSEPGSVLLMDVQGKSDLYIPNCQKERSKWVSNSSLLTQDKASLLGLSRITYLGEECSGYQLHPFFTEQEYSALIATFKTIIAGGGFIFTLSPDNAYAYVEQRCILERLKSFIPKIADHIVDISPLVAGMRRKKDMHEIELLYKAVEITTLAHEAAAEVIADGVSECEVQASLEYIMIGSCASPAFASIVASGKNSTTLHYVDNNQAMKNGQLVVVDIGARFGNYCADITRTYPVSGKFTKRQKEVYNLVLETQHYIADIAKPGVWLSNKEHPENSLNHLAKKYLEAKGYGKYFTHGIGHFLGIDVHDVGDYSKPLQEGDIITIEPGIYIPEEEIGVRIEDDYWVTKDGVICLSEGLPKKADDVERMVSYEIVSNSETLDRPLNDQA